MDKILVFIVTQCSYLYKKHNLIISRGEYYSSNGEGGIVVLEDKVLSLCFSYDRGIMNLTIKGKSKQCDEYSIWYVMELLTHNKEKWRYNLRNFPNDIPSLDKPEFYAEFSERFEDIYNLFLEKNLQDTITNLNLLVGIKKSKKYRTTKRS